MALGADNRFVVTPVTVNGFVHCYRDAMASLRAAAYFVAASLCACRTPAAHTCFPEQGAEVWVERRYPPASPASALPAALTSFRVGPGTPPANATRQAHVWITGPAGNAVPDTIVGGSDGEGRIGLPAKAQALKPGTYRIRLMDIGWAGAVRDVWFGPGERVDLEVQMRQTAYCLEPVVTTSASSPRPGA